MSNIKRYFRVNEVNEGWSGYVNDLDWYVGKVCELIRDDHTDEYLLQNMNSPSYCKAWNFPKEWCTETDCDGFQLKDRPFVNGNDLKFGFVPLSKDVSATNSSNAIREFSTGANRNSDDGKLDFEGFLSPLALEAYAKYMHENRKLENGELRDSDNWQLGIPKDQYIKSLWRHFFDTWKFHRGYETKEKQVKNLCGVIFNSMGYLHELLKEDGRE